MSSEGEGTHVVQDPSSWVVCSIARDDGFVLAVLLGRVARRTIVLFAVS